MLIETRIDDAITLLPSKTQLGKQVDFIIGKFGCVYIDEHDMNGQVNKFLPRILALRYEQYYDVTNNPNDNLLNANNSNHNKNSNKNKNRNRNNHRKAPKKVTKKRPGLFFRNCLSVFVLFQIH